MTNKEKSFYGAGTPIEAKKNINLVKYNKRKQICKAFLKDLASGVFLMAGMFLIVILMFLLG